MNRLIPVLLPVAFVLFLAQAADPSAQPVGDEPRPHAQGALVYASNCARCHEPSIEWTEGGCRPVPLTGAASRFEKRQVMNLLDHGVMTMPSFKDMPQSDRDALWGYLASLPAPADAGPTPGQSCRMVQAAMAGKPIAGGRGGGCGSGGAGKGCGGGAGQGCGALAKAAERPSHVCGKDCAGDAPRWERRRYSFGP